MKDALEKTNARAIIARERYGKYSSPHEIIGVIAEELHEATIEVHANNWPRFREELLDIAAVCIRGASEVTIREEIDQI